MWDNICEYVFTGNSFARWISDNSRSRCILSTRLSLLLSSSGRTQSTHMWYIYKHTYIFNSLYFPKKFTCNSRYIEIHTYKSEVYGHSLVHELAILPEVALVLVTGQPLGRQCHVLQQGGPFGQLYESVEPGLPCETHHLLHSLLLVFVVNTWNIADTSYK